MFDLRSDPVTKPTPGMFAAMAAAPLGDDVYGEDPTVNALEEKVAALLGTEAAVFVPTGTMSNQLAVRAQTQPGDELICEEFCHIYNWEAGGPAILSGVTCRTVQAAGGHLRGVERVARQSAADQRPHGPHPHGFCLENTADNRGGGTDLPAGDGAGDQRMGTIGSA